FQVDNESRSRVDLALYRNLEQVIVAVAVRVIALAEQALVLLWRELRIVVVVRCGEFSFAGQVEQCGVSSLFNATLIVTATVDRPRRTLFPEYQERRVTSVFRCTH